MPDACAARCSGAAARTIRGRLAVPVALQGALKGLVGWRMPSTELEVYMVTVSGVGCLELWSRVA
jgi:hypothetical protein